MSTLLYIFHAHQGFPWNLFHMPNSVRWWFPNGIISPQLLISLGSCFTLTSFVLGQCLADHLGLPQVVVSSAIIPTSGLGPRSTLSLCTKLNSSVRPWALCWVLIKWANMVFLGPIPPKIGPSRSCFRKIEIGSGFSCPVVGAFALPFPGKMTITPWEDQLSTI